MVSPLTESATATNAHPTGEHIFLHFGNYANHVAAHFWNGLDAQREAGTLGDAHPFYHSNSRGDSVHPRALLFDLQGAFHYAYREPQESDSVSPAWTGKTETYNLGDTSPRTTAPRTPQLWSDYSRTRFHAQSLHEIKQHQYQNELVPFDTYTSGRALGADMDFIDTCVDGDFRHFAEASDSLECIHATVDVLDGFGGLGSAFLELVRDDLPKLPIVVFACESRWSPDWNEREIRKKQVNRALCMAHLSDLASLYIPLSEDRVVQPWNSLLTTEKLTTRYQTSAVIATAIDTLLCPMLTRNGYSAGHLTSFMNWRRDTKVVDLSIAFPLEMRQEDTAQDVLDRWSHMKMHSLSPLPAPKKDTTSVGSATIPLEESTDRRGEVFAQSLVFRGVSDRSNVRMGDPAHSSCNGDLLRDRIITIDKCRQTMCNLYTTAFPYAKPFPPLFSRRLGADGVVATPATWKVAESDDTAAEDRNADDYDTAPTQLRIATRLRNGTDIHTLIEREYVDQMRCIRAGQLWEFSDKGEMMSADDLVALRESLMSLSDAYSERDREW